MSRSTTTSKKTGDRFARTLQPPTKREREALAAAVDRQIAGILRPEENAPIDRVGLVNQKTGETLAVLTVDEYRAVLDWIRGAASAAREDKSEMSGAAIAERSSQLATGKYAGVKKYRARASDDLAKLQQEADIAGSLLTLREVLDGERTLTSISAYADMPEPNLPPASAVHVNQRHHHRTANARRLIAHVMDHGGYSEYQRALAVRDIAENLRAKP